MYGMPAPNSECQHPEAWPASTTFEKGVSQNEIFISLKKKWNVVLYEEEQTKVRLQSKTYVFNNNIERVAPYNRLYGATRLLHLTKYLVVQQAANPFFPSLHLGRSPLLWRKLEIKKVSFLFSWVELNELQLGFVMWLPVIWLLWLCILMNSSSAM